MSDPLAYFLTWHTYGSWLHGHARGSVDDEHSAHDSPFAPPDATRLASSAARLVNEPLALDELRRDAVQAAVVEVCAYRGWLLLALHVRTTHVHAVVTAPAAPEKVMNDLKAYATRRLRRERLAAEETRVWSTHGSTRYLWDEAGLAEVIAYVVEQQGVALNPAPIRTHQSPQLPHPSPER
jgi:REP element-mobilizing transposase RayT